MGVFCKIDYVLGTHARLCLNKIGIALDLFVSLRYKFIKCNYVFRNSRGSGPGDGL